jgi:hypothetical protein
VNVVSVMLVSELSGTFTFIVYYYEETNSVLCFRMGNIVPKPCEEEEKEVYEYNM